MSAASILKTCTKCGTLKPLDDFHAYKRSPDGKRTVCKVCRADHRSANAVAINAAARDFARANPERIRAKSKRYYKNNREKVVAGARAWVLAHPEQVTAYQKQWRAENADHMKAHDKAYAAARRPEKNAYERERRKTNPAWEKSKKHTRRAREAAGGRFTPAEWDRLCEHYGRRCLACGRTDVKLTVDHVIPLSMGGSNQIENLQPLCMKCNVDKGQRHIDHRPELPDWFRTGEVVTPAP